MSPKTLLIVDDSKLSRMMICAIVQQAHPDWRIIEAENGEQALDKARSTAIDVMTLDFNMPGMDGLTLAERLQESFPLASVALITANIQRSIRERARGLGIGFIQKSITEAKILSYIET